MIRWHQLETGDDPRSLEAAQQVPRPLGRRLWNLRLWLAAGLWPGFSPGGEVAGGATAPFHQEQGGVVGGHEQLSRVVD
jgi:hypothetical protein